MPLNTQNNAMVLNLSLDLSLDHYHYHHYHWLWDLKSKYFFLAANLYI